MPTEDLKAQIQELISLGKTEEALDLLGQLTSDAVLLQSRFNGAKRQYSMGMIDFSEWSRTQAQINYAALEMANSVKVKPAQGNGTQGQSGQTTTTTTSSIKPKVFISYNHEDDHTMRLAKGYLEQNGCQVFVDVQNIEVGGNIEDFIQKALQDNQFILSIISTNSLRSGWVNKELSASLLLNKFGKKWLPVLLDKKCLEPSFYNDTMDEFDEKIKGLQEEIQKSLAKGRDIRAFTDKLERAKDLQNDFSKTIQALDGHAWVDISGQQLEFGMSKVVNTINKTT